MELLQQIHGCMDVSIQLRPRNLGAYLQQRLQLRESGGIRHENVDRNPLGSQLRPECIDSGEVANVKLAVNDLCVRSSGFCLLLEATGALLEDLGTSIHFDGAMLLLFVLAEQKVIDL